MTVPRTTWSSWVNTMGLDKSLGMQVFASFDGDGTGSLDRTEAAKAVNFLEVLQLESNIRFHLSALLAIALVVLPWAFASCWLLQDALHDLAVVCSYDPDELGGAVKRSLPHARWLQSLLETFEAPYRTFYAYLRRIHRAGREPRAQLCMVLIVFLIFPLLGPRAQAISEDDLGKHYYSNLGQILLLQTFTFMGLYLSLRAADKSRERDKVPTQDGDSRLLGGGSNSSSDADAHAKLSKLDDPEIGNLNGLGYGKKFDDLAPATREICLLPVHGCNRDRFRLRLGVLLLSSAALFSWQMGTFPLISKVLTAATHDPSDPTRAIGSTSLVEQASSWQSFFGGVAPAVDYSLSFLGAPRGAVTSTVWAFNSATGLGASWLRLREGYTPEKDESMFVSLQKQAWAAARYQTQWGLYYWVWLVYAQLPWVCLLLGAGAWYCLQSSQTLQQVSEKKRDFTVVVSLGAGGEASLESLGSQMVFQGTISKNA